MLSMTHEVSYRRLGGHLDKCDERGHELPLYNSCRNRHCRSARASTRHAGSSNRCGSDTGSLLHAVFTVPACLQPLLVRDRRQSYACSSAWPGRRSARSVVGGWERCPVIAVLHTWSDPRFSPTHPIGSSPEAESTRAVSTGSAAVPTSSSQCVRRLASSAASCCKHRALVIARRWQRHPARGGFAAVGRVQQTTDGRSAAGAPLPRPLHRSHRH